MGSKPGLQDRRLAGREGEGMSEDLIAGLAFDVILGLQVGLIFFGKRKD